MTVIAHTAPLLMAVAFAPRSAAEVYLLRYYSVYGLAIAPCQPGAQQRCNVRAGAMFRGTTQTLMCMSRDTCMRTSVWKRC